MPLRLRWKILHSIAKLLGHADTCRGDSPQRCWKLNGGANDGQGAAEGRAGVLVGFVVHKQQFSSRCCG